MSDLELAIAENRLEDAELAAVGKAEEDTQEDVLDGAAKSSLQNVTLSCNTRSSS